MVADPFTSLELRLLASYVLTLFIGGWTWDLLLSLIEELELCRRSYRSAPTIVYILARVTTLAYLTQALVLDMFGYAGLGGAKISLSNELRLSASTGMFYAVAVPLNSLIFFFRVRAVFHDSPKMVIMFGVLWLLTLASLAAPITCIAFDLCGPLNGFAQSGGVFAMTIYDSALFFAVNFRLVAITSPPDFKSFMRTFFLGKGMGRISRELFISGQIYYLTTVGINMFFSITMIVAFAGVGSKEIEVFLLYVAAVPSVVLQNALACRVHRHIKLGVTQEDKPTLGYKQLATIDGGPE